MKGRHGLINYALSVGVFVLLWKTVSAVVASPVLPPPEAVLRIFLLSLTKGDFWQNFGISAYRVIAGIVIGWCAAFPAGIILGYSRHLDNLLSPLVFMTYPIPKIVFLPLILIFFGLGDLSKIVLISVIIFFQILVATRDGVKSIDAKYYDSVRSMGGKDQVILREVVIPATLPSSFTALRIGIGTAISVLFFVEAFATDSGLGFLIMDSWARMDHGRIFVGIIGMSLLGVLLYELSNLLEIKFCPWKFATPERTAGARNLADQLTELGSRVIVYGRMIKFGHTVFALPFALAALLLAHRESPVTFNLVFWVITAMVGARSAAMGFNRLVDAEVDRKNPRTLGRELPAGLIGRRETLVFVIVSSLLFVVASAFISRMCLILSFVVVPLLLGYSYTKLFTWLSHFVLGAVIGLAPLGVWVAVTGTFSFRIMVLSFTLFTYISGFDILYACQDEEFDRREGLFSIPARFGAERAMKISAVLHVITFGSLLSLFWLFSLTPVYLGFVAVMGLLLILEHRLVRPEDLSRIDVAFYHVNSIISVLLFLAMMTEEIIRRVM